MTDQLDSFFEDQLCEQLDTLNHIPQQTGKYELVYAKEGYGLNLRTARTNEIRIILPPCSVVNLYNYMGGMLFMAHQFIK